MDIKTLWKRCLRGAAITDGTYTPVINESDDSGMSGESAVADADLTTTEALAALAATDDNVVKRIGYTGSKRYVTCDIVSASTTSGGTLGVVAVLGHASAAPVAQGS